MQTRTAATHWRSIHAARVEAQEDVPESDQLDVKEKQRRGEQWRRTMLLAEYLMGARNGLHVEDLARRINDWMGTDYHARTIRRDVDLLGSLGLAEMKEGIVTWCPHHYGLCRVVVSAVTMPDPDRAKRRPSGADIGIPISDSRRPSAMQSAIDQLPPPWDLTERQIRAANEAVRILALIDTGDTAWVDAVLIYQLGAGWKLRRPGADAPSRHAFASAITTEEQTERAEDAISGLLQDDWDAFDDERWELGDDPSRDVGRVPR